MKRAPLKPLMAENNDEMWHLYLFNVLIWGTLQLPHRSTQIWFASGFSLMYVMIYSLSLFQLHFAFINKLLIFHVLVNVLSVYCHFWHTDTWNHISKMALSYTSHQFQKPAELILPDYSIKTPDDQIFKANLNRNRL